MEIQPSQSLPIYQIDSVYGIQILEIRRPKWIMALIQLCDYSSLFLISFVLLLFISN